MHQISNADISEGFCVKKLRETLLRARARHREVPLQLRPNALLSQCTVQTNHTKPTEKSTLLVLVLQLYNKWQNSYRPSDQKLCSRTGKRDAVGEPLLLISSSRSHMHVAQLHNTPTETTGWSGGKRAGLRLPMNGRNSRSECMWLGVAGILS